MTNELSSSMLPKTVATCNAKTVATNSIVEILNTPGHIPLGCTPREQLLKSSVCDDPITFYPKFAAKYLNAPALHAKYGAVTEKNKAKINLKLIEYSELFLTLLIARAQYIVEGDRQFQFPHDEFSKRVGQPHRYGTTRRLSFVSAVLDVCPLYTIQKQGNNITGEVSVIKLNHDLIQLINTDLGQEVITRVYEQDISQLLPEQRDDAPIDVASLEAFIKGNQNLAYRNQTTERYNRQAQLILMVARLNNNCLPQVINESIFGRRYYQGLNLQNTSKPVRAAALGDCYEYDLHAAVYAIKYVSCLTIIPDMFPAGNYPKFTYTSEYLEGGGKFKKRIRETIAQATFLDEDKPAHVRKQHVETIKTALTMIGFGASKTGNGFFNVDEKWTKTSLQTTFSIYNPATKKSVLQQDCYDRFMNNTWVSKFFDEQKLMSDIIFDCLCRLPDAVTGRPLFEKSNPELARLIDGTGGFNRNRVIAYFFQHQERRLMDQINEFCKQQGNEVLLRVHDAIFTRRPIPQVELHQQVFKQWLTPGDPAGDRVLSLHETQIKRFTWDTERSEHQEFIKQEEIRAAAATGQSHQSQRRNHAPVAAIASDSRAYDGGVDWGTRSIDLYDNDTWNSLTTRAEKQEYCRNMGVSMPDSVAATTPLFIQQLLKQ